MERVAVFLSSDPEEKCQNRRFFLSFYCTPAHTISTCAHTCMYLRLLFILPVHVYSTTSTVVDSFVIVFIVDLIVYMYFIYYILYN